MMHAFSKAETRLKAAVIDQLFAAGAMAGDTVLAAEMTVASWSRRTDIVLANGRLWGFELKSQADTLTRLPAQLETFSKYFEKLILVVAKKFEQRTRDAIDSSKSASVGLWVEQSDGTLTECIRPKVSALSSEASIELMTVCELRRCLASAGHQGLRAIPRPGLAAIAARMSPNYLANSARQSIKDRYRSHHLRFIRAREEAGTLSAMHELRRYPTPPPAMGTSIYERADVMEMPIPHDHPELHFAPAGPVLRRKVG